MRWLTRFRSLPQQRRKALANCAPGPLHDFLSAPVIDRKTRIDETPLLALDLETTGLDPNTDEIVSVGLVELQHGRIPLRSHWHCLVKPQRALNGHSVTIHRITDDQLHDARPLAEVLPQLLSRLAGKIMLVHYKRIEQQFLNTACQRLYGASFLVQTIDTVELGLRVLERRNHTIGTNDLRLYNLRRWFNLPDYEAHNALTDALSTAELFLALCNDISPRHNAPVSEFLSN